MLPVGRVGQGVDVKTGTFVAQCRCHDETSFALIWLQEATVQGEVQTVFRMALRVIEDVVSHIRGTSAVGRLDWIGGRFDADFRQIFADVHATRTRAKKPILGLRPDLVTIERNFEFGRSQCRQAVAPRESVITHGGLQAQDNFGICSVREDEHGRVSSRVRRWSTIDGGGQ